MASLYLFDDARASGWKPFALTRPVGELLFGALTLRERSERILQLKVVGHLAGEGLLGFEEPGAPPAVSHQVVGTGDTRILLSSRVVLEWGATLPTNETATLTVAGRTVGWVLAPGQDSPGPEVLREPERSEFPGGRLEIEASLLSWPWNLVEANPARITKDLAVLHRASNLFGLTDVHIFGDHNVSLGPDAHIEPGVVLDMREGPVRLDAGAYVEAPARLVGPLYVGARTRLLGGRIGRSSIGVQCKIHGEVDSSVISGYCNKAHDGHLGHALLGQWVNLGAATANSDLKNNYSNVRVPLEGVGLDTGLLKVGCFIGDHVKTGIGTLLTTGAVVGAGSSIFGGGMAPRYTPPFSWGSAADLGTYDPARLFPAMEAAMRRRGLDLAPGVRALFERAWEQTRTERS